MLPRVISETSVRPFKFWFNNQLQDGVHFQNELYYRLRHQPIEARSKLYQLACRLSQQGADVIFIVGDQHCSLWASLRNQEVAAITLGQLLVMPPNG